MVTVTGTVVKFSFHRPQARSVCVVGDFNDWRRDELAMKPDGAGHWRASLRLPPGQYRFRYLADGEWFTDYAAFGVIAGPRGVDSILWVRPSEGGTVPSRPQPSAPAREFKPAGTFLRRFVSQPT